MTKIIYGFHAVLAAFQHQPENILALWVEPRKTPEPSARLAEILVCAENAGITPQPISRKKLEDLAQSEQHQGIAVQMKASAEITEKAVLTWLETANKPNPLLLILEGIQDPHNVGACLRSAQAFGVDFVIIPKTHTAPLNATVSKVASGALEQLSVVMVSNVVRFIEAIQAKGVWVLATQAGADKTLTAVDLQRPICWVMGPEGKGLKRLTLEACDEVVGIPLQSGMASLNVSVATAICLYESARQRPQGD